MCPSIRTVLFAMALTACGLTAHAATWPALPVACTPERAAPWQEGRSEEQQAACHCPPTSMCPTTYEEYSDASKSPIPMSFVMQCCPAVVAPKCPDGTLLAGQPVPADGNCNPSDTVCPDGTLLAGQPVPADGNCNPGTITECPSKYYPSVAESITNANFSEPGGGKKKYDGYTASRGTYTYDSGDKYDFDYLLGWQWAGKGQNSIVIRLSKRYNWSLRLSNLEGGMQGAIICSLNNGECAWNQYLSMTDGYHGVYKLQQLIDHFGADQLAWFGVSVVKQSSIANNLATPAVVAEFAGRDIVDIGNAAVGKGSFDGQGKKSVGPALQRDAAEFLSQCRKVTGEYIELTHRNIGDTQCAYLQCRYVYEDTRESCLSGDTSITLADGSTKAVKDLKLGDVVKGSEGDHKITAANTYQSGLRVLYGINGSDAMLTGDHPIRTKDGWKVITEDAAKIYAGTPGFAKTKLEVGDVLVTEKGDVKVESITRFPKVDPVSTYNIKVEGNQGFFANGIEVKGFSKMEMHYR